ncbi:MAG: glutamine--tRNA ligase/YqeY domain fusion protein [SAR202 cluster bacterium]|nr:MAG: glutamine--tRNA ligase/YqeY domain fusion protein [SAR202 cluster bacterium]MEC8987272.1 glutamine--tRNA ligase/YqeY domain fusion protein [Chloroflexota bacterium]MED5409612.1 glutamine--tRNA ligase/YqeY domain fusion protein [Chloroflexota bacterium]MED5450414.1 glutamine--tRNA ligase/YqeY domain fusion protein [Chloroflexota bacterium]MEE3345065.1 glutamine--tRNA ligase/YqeY domain fusion protein [Chloroflexota bacterium]
MEENIHQDFIRDIIKTDLASGKHKSITTRFPPEPNGYLHIGHAASICLNFGIAAENNLATCNLRFDDTNPSKENTEFVEAIKTDIEWLGFSWDEREYFASDYFEKLHGFAITLIEKGKAYVDSQTQEQIRTNRGTLTQPGHDSPYRARNVQENLNLFVEMREGKHQPGSHVLRAKIDMSSPNLNMRDPVMYRILDTPHHRTGTDWPIYPMYDFAHGLSDSIEGVTHSLCTMEYEDHRPLYDWFIDELEVFKSRQIEFGKIFLSHTILSKRNLTKLVENKLVSGWDDPRMPTISGMRRLGYSAESIKDFCKRVSITRRWNTAEIELLEHCLREDLNKKANRALAVLKPVKVVIENYPENQVEYLEALNNPQDADSGTRKIPFSKEIYIEQEDFMEKATNKFYRLTPGREVRLRYGYFITCTSAIKDPVTNEIVEIRCTYDPETRGGNAPDGRKVKSTIHWVSASHAVDAEIRLYERLCLDPEPDISDGQDLESVLNPNSLETITSAKLEPSLKDATPGNPIQFERLGYFCLDFKDSTGENNLVFNRTVSLRDSWNKRQSAS